MTAQITTRITDTANRHAVLAVLGTILPEEFAAQEALAIADTADPDPYRIRVFSRRTNPISRWLEAPDSFEEDSRAIVNVSFDRHDPELAKSNIVKRRAGPARFFLDCFGYGKAKLGTSGHDPGDVLADEKADWVAFLVEQILMSGHYAYLGMRGIVGRRFVESVERMRVGTEEHPVQNVAAYRVTLAVELFEESPQVVGQPLETIDIDVQRQEDDKVIAERTIDLT